MRAWRHMTSLWPRYAPMVTFPFWGWAICTAFLGRLRWDVVAVALFAVTLAYGNRQSKKLYLGLLPIGLVGVLYDAMHYVKNVGLSESTVHVCDLRQAEMRWFGITVDGVRMTVHDWFQAHAVTWLDLLAAVPYGTFIFVVACYAIFLFFRDFSAQQRFTWGFFALNVAGFITYHIYPAAPPWYFHAHGCAVDLATHASAGPNLTRVDALVGIPYFAGFYGRSNDVFGAVPSLHVSYPLLMITQGWSKHRSLGRTLLVLFYLSMCFSAAYLDHHWIIDIVLGSGYALATAAALRLIARPRELHIAVPPSPASGGEPNQC